MIYLDVLARAPVVGQVKTRLIPALGANGATRAYEQLLGYVVAVGLDWCHDLPERQLRLWCTPDTKHPYFDTLLPEDKRYCQPTGDLGQRMAAIVESGLASADGVILLGGDVGSVSTLLLDQVEEALHKVPVVMAPAEDGGYILLGLTRFAPTLFTDMPWGTDQIAEKTRQRLKAIAWPWQEFSGHWDVDRPMDWERFQKSVSCP